MTKREMVNNFMLSIEKERVTLGLTQTEMAQTLGLSVSGYKKMVAGETSKIDLYIAYRMYQLTGKWLFELCGETSEQMEVVSKLRQLSASQLNFIRAITDFELAFRTRIPEAQADDYVNLLTLTGNMEDGMFWDSYNIEKLNVSSYRRRFGTDLHCAIRVNTDHLHPVYQSGDILFVSLSSPRDGDTGIFVNKETGRTYLRRFHQAEICLLEPITHFGRVFEIDPHKKSDMDRWIRFGIILSKMR